MTLLEKLIAVVHNQLHLKVQVVIIDHNGGDILVDVGEHVFDTHKTHLRQIFDRFSPVNIIFVEET